MIFWPAKTACKDDYFQWLKYYHEIDTSVQLSANPRFRYVIEINALLLPCANATTIASLWIHSPFLVDGERLAMQDESDEVVVSMITESHMVDWLSGAQNTVVPSSNKEIHHRTMLDYERTLWPSWWNTRRGLRVSDWKYLQPWDLKRLWGQRHCCHYACVSIFSSIPI